GWEGGGKVGEVRRASVAKRESNYPEQVTDKRRRLRPVHSCAHLDKRLRLAMSHCDNGDQCAPAARTRNCLAMTEAGAASTMALPGTGPERDEPFASLIASGQLSP